MVLVRVMVMVIVVMGVVSDAKWWGVREMGMRWWWSWFLVLMMGWWWWK